MKKDLEAIKDHYKPIKEGGRYSRSTKYTFAKAILLLMEAMEEKKV